MRWDLIGVAALSCVVAASRPASAAVQIEVDLSTQTMHVAGGGQEYSWPVSSARAGYSTPRGVYRPTSLQAVHFSHKYDNSPMPHSIFFKGGYAIHGTYEASALGRPASHGCVRLSLAHAAELYKMVQAEGARIEITGQPPHASSTLAVLHRISRPSPVRAQPEQSYASPVFGFHDESPW
jgi:hypothetical protein